METITVPDTRNVPVTVGSVEVFQSRVISSSGMQVTIQAAEVKIEEFGLKSVFDELMDEWENKRPRGADIAEMINNSIYQKVISLGSSVVPLLLAQLEKKPDHWFWALFCLTGVDPVPVESQGKFNEMVATWLAWGRQQGYQW